MAQINTHLDYSQKIQRLKIEFEITICDFTIIVHSHIELFTYCQLCCHVNMLQTYMHHKKKHSFAPLLFALCFLTHYCMPEKKV